MNIKDKEEWKQCLILQGYAKADLAYQSMVG